MLNDLWVNTVDVGESSVWNHVLMLNTLLASEVYVHELSSGIRY